MTVDVAARTLLLAFAIGCGMETPPGPVDTDPAPTVEPPHTGAPVPLPTARLDPPSPTWADAVRCISPDLGDARLVDVRFWVNGVAIRAGGLQPPTGTPSTRVLPADASLGMDSIRCALRVEHPVAGDVWIESKPWTVEPPLPAVATPPGSFLWRASPWDEPAAVEATVTYAMAFGATEVSDKVFESIIGYPVPAHGLYADEVGPNHPVMMVNWHQAARFTVELSLLDGSPGCFTCDAGEQDDVRCEPVKEYLECDGWRLPTVAEWLYAADSAGHADSTYAVVGEVQPNDLTWWTHADGDIDVIDGPYAGTKLGAQCWWVGARTATGAPRRREVGASLPNAYGIHDLCGNASEWTVDAPLESIGGVDTFSARVGARDRIVLGGDAASDPVTLSRWNLGRRSPASNGTDSVRIVRTLSREVPSP